MEIHGNCHCGYFHFETHQNITIWLSASHFVCHPSKTEATGASSRKELRMALTSIADWKWTYLIIARHILLPAFIEFGMHLTKKTESYLSDSIWLMMPFEWQHTSGLVSNMWWFMFPKKLLLLALTLPVKIWLALELFYEMTYSTPRCSRDSWRIPHGEPATVDSLSLGIIIPHQSPSSPSPRRLGLIGKELSRVFAKYSTRINKGLVLRGWPLLHWILDLQQLFFHDKSESERQNLGCQSLATIQSNFEYPTIRSPEKERPLAWLFLKKCIYIYIYIIYIYYIYILYIYV
jgi:hypothetical protein